MSRRIILTWNGSAYLRGLYIEIDIEYFRYRSQGESVTRQQ